MAVSSHLRKILFYGTDDFSTPVLAKLHRAGHSIHAVTVPHTRPTKVMTYCNKYSIPCEPFNKGTLPFHHSPSFRQSLPQHIGVCASFGQLIPKKVISSVGTFLNVHPSMIPQYRGAAPIQHALLNGDCTTGITILEVLPRRFDIGRVYHQEQVALPKDQSGLAIRAMLAMRSGEVLCQVLDDLESITPVPQCGVTTKAPSLHSHYIKQLSCVDPLKQSAERIYNVSRVVNSGVWVLWDGRRLKLREVLCLEKLEQGVAGEFYYDERSGVLVLQCLEGCLGVRSVILPNSGTSSDRMPVERFYRGHCKGREKVMRGLGAEEWSLEREY